MKLSHVGGHFSMVRFLKKKSKVFGPLINYKNEHECTMHQNVDVLTFFIMSKKRQF